MQFFELQVVEFLSKPSSLNLTFSYCEDYEHIFKTAGRNLCSNSSSWSSGKLSPFISSKPLAVFSAYAFVPADLARYCYRLECCEHLMTGVSLQPLQRLIAFNISECMLTNLSITARPGLLTSPCGVCIYLAEDHLQ